MHSTQFVWCLRLCLMMTVLSPFYYFRIGFPAKLLSPHFPDSVSSAFDPLQSHVRCRPLDYRDVNSQQDGVIALASFPGSGNTWTRYLLQQSTGIITGDIYMANELIANGK